MIITITACLLCGFPAHDFPVPPIKTNPVHCNTWEYREDKRAKYGFKSI